VGYVIGQNKEESRLQAQIDENLKRVYDETLSAELPERFKVLLAQLREKQAEKQAEE
jgi:hypothetical protein